MKKCNQVYVSEKLYELIKGLQIDILNHEIGLYGVLTEEELSFKKILLDGAIKAYEHQISYPDAPTITGLPGMLLLKRKDTEFLSI